jgi:hypothetical protein
MDERRAIRVSAMGSPMVTPNWSDPKIFYNRKILLGNETRSPWDELIPPPRAWYEDTKREERGERDERLFGLDKQTSSTHPLPCRKKKYGMCSEPALSAIQKAKAPESKTKKEKKKSRKKKVFQTAETTTDEGLGDEAELGDNLQHVETVKLSLEHEQKSTPENNLQLPDTITAPADNTSVDKRQAKLRSRETIIRNFDISREVLHSEIHFVLPYLSVAETPTLAVDPPTEDVTLAKDTPPVDDAPAANILRNSTHLKTLSSSHNGRVETTTILDHEFPNISVREQKSIPEALLEQLKSLRHQLAKKERDIKSARNQSVVATRTTVEKVKKKHAEEIEKLRREHSRNLQELEAQHTLEYNELREQRDETEAKREKDTIDLQKLRHVCEKLRGEVKSLQITLDTELAEFVNVKRELECLKMKESKQALLVGLLNIEVTERATKQRELEQRLVIAEEKCTARHQKISEYSADNIKLRDEIFLARSQGFLPTQHTESGTVEFWNNRLRLKEESDLKSKTQGLEKEIIRLRKILEEICIQSPEATSENVEQWDIASQLHAKVTKLEMEVSSLKQDRDLKAPLIQLAVDIRLRYLEIARETAFQTSRTDENKVIIMNGNIAAHRANGAVDAAIFKAGLVPACYKEAATKIFEHLYLLLPEQYGCWSPKTQRIQDCSATLASLKLQNNFKQSEWERGEHEKIRQKLISLSSSMSEDDFESSKEVEQLVVKLEYLNGQIVERDRAKHPRPTGKWESFAPNVDTSERPGSGLDGVEERRRMD